MKPRSKPSPTLRRTLGRAVPVLLVTAVLGSSMPSASAFGKRHKPWERKAKTESPTKKRSGLLDRARSSNQPTANVASATTTTTKKRKRLLGRLRESREAKPQAATRSSQPVRVRATAQSQSRSRSQASTAVRKKREGILARIFKPEPLDGAERSASGRKKRPSGPAAPNPVQAPPRFNDALLAQAKSRGGSVVVNIASQRATLYVGGKVALDTPVSTARSGKRTPRGSFGVGQRVRQGKVSTIYHVEMPYWMRLGQSAYGMHAGYLPGYPASAGCIRMPYQAAQKLYDATGYGTRVRITGG